MYSFCRLGTDCKPSVVRILFLLDKNHHSILAIFHPPEIELLNAAKILDAGHFPDQVARQVQHLQLRQPLEAGNVADP